jgi:hypothetical protein
VRDRAPAFLWCDAWVLLAAGMAAPSGPAPLTRLVGAADAAQHAVPTPEELNGALGRLGRAGYLQVAPEGIALTAAGRALLAAAERAGRALAAQQRALERALGAAAWTPGYDPHAARGAEAEHVSPAEYEAAVREYGDRARGRPERPRTLRPPTPPR